MEYWREGVVHANVIKIKYALKKHLTYKGIIFFLNLLILGRKILRFWENLFEGESNMILFIYVCLYSFIDQKQKMIKERF